MKMKAITTKLLIIMKPISNIGKLRKPNNVSCSGIKQSSHINDLIWLYLRKRQKEYVKVIKEAYHGCFHLAPYVGLLDESKNTPTNTHYILSELHAVD